GRDRRFAATTGDALLNRDTRRQTGDKIDIRSFELLNELPRVRRHAVEKSSLPFGEQNVERECRFTGTAQSGNDHHLIARNFDVDIFQIVLARAVDADLAAFVSRFRSKIDNPVGGLNHFKIMLDHYDRVTGVDQPLKNFQQHRDVIEMQTRGRFVKDEEVATPAVTVSWSFSISRFSQMPNEF